MLATLNLYPQFCYSVASLSSAALAIESAVSIVPACHSLICNTYENYRIQKLFPDHKFSTNYNSTKLPNFNELKKDLENNLDKFQPSFQPKENEPVLTLKCENSNATCEVDLITFKLFCPLYDLLCQNFEYNHPEFSLLNFSEANFELLKTYLFNPSTLSLNNLDVESLCSFFLSVNYLEIEALEKHCILQMANLITSSKNWEKINELREHMSPENSRILQELILTVEEPKFENRAYFISESKQAIISNICLTIFFGLATLHPVTSILSTLTFVCLSSDVFLFRYDSIFKRSVIIIPLAVTLLPLVAFHTIKFLVDTLMEVWNEIAANTEPKTLALALFLIHMSNKK